MDGRAKKPSKQKRKLQKNCPNPLFLKWLEEWRDEAKSKESKLQYVYSKAISSLKKYPLPLESGREATLLDGVGPGIAKQLDEQLARHRRNLANNPNVVYDVEETSIGESNFLDLSVPPPPTMMSAGTPSSSTCYTSSSENVSQPKPKKKRNSSPREYVPAYKSGPYAIMIALLKASERNGYKGYMTKAELQQQAQPFTETSFTVPDPGSYYTAWSSMSTLIKKGLVVKSSHPPRFHLSDSGHILAYRLQTATGNENATFGSPTYEGLSPTYEGLSPSTTRTFNSPVSPYSTTTTTTKISNKLDKEKAIPKKTTAKSKKAAIQLQTAVSTNTTHLQETTTTKPYSKPTKDFLASYRYKTSGTEVVSNQCGSLKYWYANSDGECVEKEDNAAVIIDAEISFGYLIKCKHVDLEVSGLRYKLDHSRSSQDGYVFAFLDSNCITQHNMTVENTLATKKSRDDIDDEEILMRPLFERLKRRIEDPDICISQVKSSISNSTSNKKTEEKKLLEDSSVCKPTESLPCAPKRTVTPQFELKPGSFEIILCVDFTEATGGAKTKRKEEMVKELRMNGVQFDVRKLNVGDFLWIVKEKMLPVPGQLVLPEQRELVLDYIVERKRMDDLCSSIKDGRFKEQKFRLLNSGLRHPVYLVEDFGSPNILSMPAQTLEQAIVNTQVGQEFFVKRTRDIKESAAYLTLMTRYLQTAYSNKTLKAIKREDMEFVSVDENQLNTFLMTFQELSDISLKNRVLTAGEVFGKQLLQIPGVAVEKAVSILESYPTLRHLLDDYEEQSTEKEKESLLSGLKYSKSERKIGPSVSKTVYQLYCQKGALL